MRCTNLETWTSRPVYMKFDPCYTNRIEFASLRDSEFVFHASAAQESRGHVSEIVSHLGRVRPTNRARSFWRAAALPVDLDTLPKLHDVLN